MDRLSMILGRNEVMRARLRLGVMATVSMCVVLALSGLVLASDFHMVGHGKTYHLSKVVLEYGCNNPIEGAEITLFSHECQRCPGVVVWEGVTDEHGMADLGEWEEGWYSINVSYNGIYGTDPLFYLAEDKVIYNYLVIPPQWPTVWYQTYKSGVEGKWVK